MPESYEIGYCKPPKHSQFQTGQSGNPKGRKKGTKNTHTLLDSVLSEKILLTENGKTHKISKKEAVIRRLVNKALSGDMKALGLLLADLHGKESAAEAQKAVSAYSDGLDQEILSDFLQQNSGDNHGKV